MSIPLPVLPFTELVSVTLKVSIRSGEPEKDESTHELTFNGNNLSDQSLRFALDAVYAEIAKSLDRYAERRAHRARKEISAGISLEPRYV